MAYILFIDGDDSVRDMSVSTLELLRHRVSSTGSSSAAFELFSQHPDLFDLAILDYNLPGEKGVQLARRFKKVRGDIPILLYMARVAEDILEEARAAGIDLVANKPLLREELRETIGQAMKAFSSACPSFLYRPLFVGGKNLGPVGKIVSEEEGSGKCDRADEKVEIIEAGKSHDSSGEHRPYGHPHKS
jgi:CheY-like chemotaxis protein